MFDNFFILLITFDRKYIFLRFFEHKLDLLLKKNYRKYAFISADGISIVGPFIWVQVKSAKNFVLDLNKDYMNLYLAYKPN